MRSLTKINIEKEYHMLSYVCFLGLCGFNTKSLFEKKENYMEKLIYDFDLMIQDGDLKVGDEIYTLNDRKAEVLSIKILGWKVKIKGKDKLKRL